LRGKRPFIKYLTLEQGDEADRWLRARWPNAEGGIPLPHGSYRYRTTKSKLRKDAMEIIGEAA
jgi:hypothetical protein